MGLGSKLYSIAFNKCPKCHQGDFFVTKTSFQPKFDQIHHRCEHCNETLMPETGFYWGALYVSYALYVIWCMTAFIVYNYVLKLDLDYFLVFLIPTLVLLMPWFFRLARRTWLNLFVNYDPAKAKNKAVILSANHS